MSLLDRLKGWVQAGPEQVHHAPAPVGTVHPGESPFDAIAVGLYGSKVTRGTGVITYIDSDGEVQSIPQTQSSFADFSGAYPDVSGDDVYGGDAAALGLGPYVVDPPIAAAAEDAELHRIIHDARGQMIRSPLTVNHADYGIPNLGPVNDQPFFTARSQIVPHIPSEEQGWGLDPAIAEPRYPHAENPNPYYNLYNWRRNGQLDFSSEGIPFGAVTNHRVQAIEEMRRNRSATHVRVVDNPPMSAFSDTVPIEGQAGPLPDPMPAYDQAIY